MFLSMAFGSPLEFSAGQMVRKTWITALTVGVYGLFWLGVHHPGWLAKTTVPLFVSRRRSRHRSGFPGRWARGHWTPGHSPRSRRTGRFQVSAQEYAQEIKRYADEIGRLEWAAPQDWMCEPHILAKTGLTVAEHQRRTIEGYLELRAVTPLVIPVVQGWQPTEYETHVEQYTQAGVDLTQEPVVGIGSVCRRQDMATGSGSSNGCGGWGSRLHGFGVKTTGLRAFAHLSPRLLHGVELRRAPWWTAPRMPAS